ncbi:MAG: hypothetical protein ACYDAH_19210 [Steroidobacteraceae bacterium]
MRVVAKRGEERVQIIANMHHHLRVGKNTPHGARQILMTDFCNPAPPGIVNRYRQAGLEHRARFFGKTAPGKIDMPYFGVRETAAGRE